MMDFRSVSWLFADPDWDGPIEPDPDYDPNRPVKPKPPINPPPGPGPIIDPPPIQPKPYVDANGCEVHIINKTVSIYDANGKLLRQESIIDYTKTNIRGEYASLDRFIAYWNAIQKKAEVSSLLRERGIDLQALKEDQDMADVDDFDFICHVAYDKKPLTRKERAEGVKKQDFFTKYSGVAKEILEVLLDKYMNLGIYQIESMKILSLDPLKNYGTPAKIVG